MKKNYFLLLLAAILLTPMSAMADSWTKVVTNASEVKAALKSAGVGVPGETYELVCDWDAGTNVNVGVLKKSGEYPIKGRLVIRSNVKKMANMPQLTINFERPNGWVTATDSLKPAEKGQGLSMIFQDMRLSAGGRSYFLDACATQWVCADTLAFRNCELENSLRSWIRWDGPANDDNAKSYVDWLEYTGCVCHDMNMDSGNNWSMTRMFVPVGNMLWKDCIFYNMPYTKSLLEGRYPGDSPAYITFANNLVLLAQNKNVAKTGFTVLMPGSNLATGTEVEIANNIFVGPQKGSKILANVPVDVTVKVYDENGMVVKDSLGNDMTEVVKDSLTNYNNTAITDIHNATVYFDNNVIDESAYIDLETMANTLTSYETGASFVTLGTNYKLTDFDWFSWDDEKPFQKPDEDQYFMLKSNPWFTDGLGLNVDDLTSPTYIGPSVAYLDAFPTPVNVNIKVDAPAFVDYSVKPEKSQYYVGDEVTVNINDHNSYYRTFSRFEGWSDGESQMNRKIVVEGDIDLTATLTQTIPVLAAFDFSSVTGKDMASVNAEIYHDMDKAYQAKCSAIVCLGDSTTMSADSLSFEKFLYVDGVFNTRAEKFSEDDAEMRMPIVSRRTKANLKLLGRTYALIQLSTKGFKDVTVAGFVGTDNNSAKLQAIEYSLDNENWTRVADKELTAALKWEEITAALPEACNDQDVVYVRFIGDVSKGHVIHPDYTDWGMDENGNFPEGSTFFAQDAFEYLGNILITGTAADGSGIANIVSAENTNAQTYNIAGQKVGNGYKGIVIVNGRKYVTK